jgi:hypothetical protein
MCNIREGYASGVYVQDYTFGEGLAMYKILASTGVQ